MALLKMLLGMTCLGAQQAASSSFLIHETVDVGYLALRLGRLRFGFTYHVLGQSVLTLRMAQSVSMCRRSDCHPQSIQPRKQFLVYRRYPYATRLGSQSKGLVQSLFNSVLNCKRSPHCIDQFSWYSLVC